MADLVFTKVLSNNFNYSRLLSEQSLMLADHIKQLYAAQNCIITQSGMSAISSTINSIVTSSQTKINIFYSSELYCDTPRLIQKLSKIHTSRVTSYVFDIVKNNLIDLLNTYINPDLNIIFAESCSNPDGYIFPFDLIPTMRNIMPNLIIIIDNTWLSSAIFNPFNFDVDYVVVSLSKYYSAGKAIMGAVINQNNKYYSDTVDYLKFSGSHCSPHDVSVILQNIISLEDRIKKSSDLTLNIINLFKDKTIIAHPYLDNFALNNFKYMPSVFTIVVNKKYKHTLKHIKSIDIDLKTSFGASASKVDPYFKSMKDKTKCRISIGFDDNLDNIINIMNQILN